MIVKGRLVSALPAARPSGSVAVPSRVWLTAAVVALLAATPASAQVPSAVDGVVKQCAACHGSDGNSTIPNIPSLAGQPEFFLLNQLILMREGVRRIDAMAALVAPLTDDQIGTIAKHFAALPAKPSGEPIDPAQQTRGAQLATRLRCASCHRADFAGQDQMPRLAGQRLDYLIASMKALRDNTRSGADTLMTAAITGVPDADLVAIAHYVAAP